MPRLRLAPCRCFALPFPHRPDSVPQCAWQDHAWDDGSQCRDCVHYSQFRETHGLPGPYYELVGDCSLNGTATPDQCNYYDRSGKNTMPSPEDFQ
jgi:hypothetical protein